MLKKIHHVGIVVRSLEEAYKFYRDTLGLHVHVEATIEDQGVRAALLSVGDSEIELLEPISNNGGVGKFLERRGEGLHHVCFETDNVDTELAATKAKGIDLIDPKPRQGLAGMICFLHPRANHGVLVEYAQPRGPDGQELGVHADPNPQPPAHNPLPEKIDHIAIAVKDVDAAVKTFTANFGFPIARRGEEASLQIKRAFLTIGNASLELFQPTSAENPATKFIAERGEGMYLLSLEVEDLDAAKQHLAKRSVAMKVQSVPNGPRLGFISPKSTHGVLLQLIENPK